jgi:hypothetical protein
MDPRTAYQVVHMLEGVVVRGTALTLADLKLPLFGKTDELPQRARCFNDKATAPAFNTKPAWCLTLIFRPPKLRGCLIMCPVPGKKQKTANWPLAPWTRGSYGNSQEAVCM